MEFLLKNYPDDEYLFVVMEPDIELLIHRIELSGKNYLALSKETVAYINQEFGDEHFDFLLNLWGGHVFKRPTLAKAKRSLNIHPAYLPYCRGRDPVVWAIRHGLPAGVTLHQISEGLDEGAIIYRERIPFTFPITGGKLYDQVIDRSWKVFCEQWESLRTSDWVLVEQEFIENNQTHKRSDLLLDQMVDLDHDHSAKDFLYRILAHDFGDYSAILMHHGKKYSLKCLVQPMKE